MPVDPKTVDQLRDQAKAVSLRAHCPYSKFHVGAALACPSGAIFSGCNVENASYGLSNCAERTAIFQMVAGGEKTFGLIVIYTPTPKPTAPCGACRQVLLEFNPDAEVHCVCDGDEVIRSTVRDLLPHPFERANLE